MDKTPSALLHLHKGATLTCDDKQYVIVALADVNVVLAKEVGCDVTTLIKIGDLQPVKAAGAIEDSAPKIEDLSTVSSEEWDDAQERRRLIDPLLHNNFRHADGLATKIAKEAGVSRATIYRWLDRFRTTGRLSSLLAKHTERGGKGKGRIAPEVETIIKNVIESFHDTDQKQTASETIVEVRRLCDAAGLKLPAASTVRARLAWTDGRKRLARREGEAAAHARYNPILGSIPDANWPLGMVQIDHTPLPVIIVDDIHRKSIKRVWLTLAIDVNSRMCLGMYLSLDPPSAMSAGMCITHAILPKEIWLNRLGITNVEWPCWGTMDILHMDNAREFRGDMLRVAAKEYDIDLHLRPVKKPRYGAHIERMMGTVSQGLKALKGATFSGPEEKGEYDAEGNACMTFRELEKWLVLFFRRYHVSTHTGIGMSPLKKWRDGLLGTKTQPGRGLPARRLDEETLRIRFMPFIERTIQNYGVLIDHVYYYHDVLRPFINAPHPEFQKASRLFRFHRDPRDISTLYFYDEYAKRYYAIPYRDTTLPPVSLWEFKDALKKAGERGIDKDSEREVFAIITEQRKLEADAAEKTKVARRSQQRRAQDSVARTTKREELPTVTQIGPSNTIPVLPGYDPDQVEILEDE